MIGIICSSNLFDKYLVKDAKGAIVNTPYGDAFVFMGKNFVLLPRHGQEDDIPPHKINHLANMFAFKKLNINEIVGVNSCGSLKATIKPGMIVVPDDYINLWDIKTFFDCNIKHITPGIDEELRGKVIHTIRRIGLKSINKGVYIQTTGPRLETKAEIRMLKHFGDIVGMTMANEATLAKELELKYASICSVDNYCNGIVREKLSDNEVVKKANENKNNISKIVLELIK